VSRCARPLDVYLDIELIAPKWYGYVEGVGGALKLLFVLSGIIFMIVDASKGHFLQSPAKVSANASLQLAVGVSALL
jgi:hypothetical protein